MKTHIRALEDSNGEITNDQFAIATELNKYFHSVYVEDKDTSNIEPVNKSKKQLETVKITLEDVRAKLKALDKSKSVGCDSVHPHVLKECSMSLSYPLYLVFKKTLETGILPDIWKKANVTPLFKKGSKLKASNYRPVSLTSIPCKILERLIADCILDHLLKNNLLAKEQHGFLKGKSCTTNLLEYLDILTDAIHNGIPVDVLYTDFKKAFDSVSIKKLLSKLLASGISGILLKWIECFLSNRKQRVVMGDCVTDWIDVLSGVPQGSVLGPILFLIFINDLPERLINDCRLYADDNKIIAPISSQSDSKVFQNDIKLLDEWSIQWKLGLNFEKCKIMHFGTNNKEYPYFMNNNNELMEIEKSTLEKDLGVFISSDLKWAKQVKYAAGKANSMLSLLNNTFKYKDKALMKTLYCTYVRPNLEFAIQAWNPYYNKDINELEKVQRRATKLIPELRHLDYQHRLKALDLTTLEVRRLRGDLIQQFKISKGLEIIELKQAQYPAHSIGTSGPASNIRGNKHRLQSELVKNCMKRQNFFTNRVVEGWNSLPSEIVESSSINSFKSKLESINLQEIIDRKKIKKNFF